MTDAESTITDAAAPDDSDSADRPVPSFTIDLPPDWVLTDHPDALFAMRLDEETDGAWSNVVVRHMRVASGTSYPTLARATWRAFEAENPGAVVVDERLVRFGAVHYVREFEVPQTGNGDSVTRIDSFAFGPRADLPMVDLFLMTWLHPTQFGDRLKKTYVRMLSSMSFT